jgi:hypothetical protein
MLGPLFVLGALMFATYAGIRAAAAADRREACRCGRALDSRADE